MSSIEPMAAVADEQKGTKAKEEEKVRTGVIASFGSYGTNANIDAETTSAPGDEKSAISGSVSRTNREECKAVVTNNSADNSYSVGFAVVGKTSTGSQALYRTYSETLKPKASVTRELPCEEDLTMQVVLRSARKL